MRSRRAVGLDLHAVRGNFAGERFGVRVGTQPGPRKTDIDGVNSQGFHQMQDFDFFFDIGIEDGRILQTVAQRFVIQQDARTGRNRRRRGHVPIVNPFALRQGRPRLLRNCRR